MKDLEVAIDEGFDSAELLKRYTTVTMGPCQGRLCADQLRAVAERETPEHEAASRTPTTLRPPDAADHARAGDRRRARTTSSGTPR